MNLFRAGRRAIALAALAASTAGAATVSTADPNPSSPDDLAELRAEVGRLRSEVQSLRQERDAQAANKASATSSPVTTQAPPATNTGPAVIDDADRRGRFLDISEMSAGWTEDRGFFIRSDDGNFLLSPFMLLQVRDATTWRQDEKHDGSDDTQNGFEIRRLQFGFDGNVFTPDLTYRIFWQSSELTTGNLSLLMAWVQYRIHDTPWVIGGGQFKDPLDHEQLISDASQLAADRTYVDDILAGGEAFSKGADVRYDNGGPLRGEAAVTSGFNNNNTTFQDYPTNATNFGVAGRVEYKVFGNWKDYEHFTSLGNHGDLLAVGGGFDWTEAGHSDAIRHVADVQYNPGPLGLYASYLGRYTARNTAGVGGYTYDPSLRLQASYLLMPHWEAFARYDYLHLDGKEFTTPTSSTVQEFTVGSTYYFRGQNAKLTFDLSYLPNGAPTTDTGNDVLADPGNGELVFRGQFQLLL